ncbi:urease accessory protein UreF [Rhizobium paknamense]|uniref:Urease accessory protein UreF n=1 Tax=Rhizobium paknamense TaxID=1206817 RepID=A0ABU0IIB4_9HYPH|nr:urease accessory protein UreF [Rhizobium paknamense]MDQ0457160.1 urease accessory protein [Rhizobium paknamense]
MTISSNRALLRLMAWLSPAFPVGGFAWSGGLERAVQDGWVRDAAGLGRWASLLIAHGSVWNDAVLLAAAHRANAEMLASVAELAEALAGSRERHQETMALGTAFCEAAGAWHAGEGDVLPRRLAYPVAVGAVAARHGVDCSAALAAYLHAALSQLVSAAIRLGVCGQKQGVALLAELEEQVEATAHRAAQASLEDLGSATIMADMASARHETQEVRLFRS